MKAPVSQLQESLRKQGLKQNFFRFAEKPLLKNAYAVCSAKNNSFLVKLLSLERRFWNKTFFRFAEKPLLKMLTQKLLRKSFIKKCLRYRSANPVSLINLYSTDVYKKFLHLYNIISLRVSFTELNNFY